MERIEGYYWVRMKYAGGVWVIGLYRVFNGVSHWFLPGMVEALVSDQFDFISPHPISHPGEMQGESKIWLPDSVETKL